MTANIILIFPDQWRGDCLSHLGHPLVETPFVDSLANKGISFTRAYSPSPMCTPARACLATGLNPYNCGRVGYADRIPWPYRHTVMHQLKDAGYQTMQVGKTHFHPHRLSLGFEINRSYEALAKEPGFVSDYHYWLQGETGGKILDAAFENHPNRHIPRIWEHEERLHCTNWTARTAIELLQFRDPTRPFFLQIGFHRPHQPFDPPSRFFEQYLSRSMLPPAGGEWDQNRTSPGDNSPLSAGKAPCSKHMLHRARCAYYASISHIDEQIGKILFHAQRSGSLKNTWVVFASDHGELLGDHGFFQKGTPHEGSARIPLIIRPPEEYDCDRGQTRNSPVTLTDCMPTILEIAGLRPRAHVDGLSLCDYIKPEGLLGRDYIHGEHAGPRGSFHYICDGRLKYIWEARKNRQWLFDLENDPDETSDLSDSPAGRTMRQRLIALLEKRDDGLTHNGDLQQVSQCNHTRQWLREGKPPPIQA